MFFERHDHKPYEFRVLPTCESQSFNRMYRGQKNTRKIHPWMFLLETKNKKQTEIRSKPLKNKLIEVNTTLKFQDKSQTEKKSYFEVVYSSIVKIGEDIKEKKELQKIILCDIQNEIFPKLEKILINMITDSGYPGVKFEKKVDFTKLFNEKFN